MSTWNTDISAAPKGHTVTVMRNTKTKDGVIRVPVEEKVADPIWVSTKCGQVLKTQWIESERDPPGRWAGLATGEQPVAWQPFVVPEHYIFSKPVAEALSAAADRIFADGVGGQ